MNEIEKFCSFEGAGITQLERRVDAGTSGADDQGLSGLDDPDSIRRLFMSAVTCSSFPIWGSASGLSISSAAESDIAAGYNSAAILGDNRTHEQFKTLNVASAIQNQAPVRKSAPQQQKLSAAWTVAAALPAAGESPSLDNCEFWTKASSAQPAIPGPLEFTTDASASATTEELGSNEGPGSSAGPQARLLSR